MNNSAIIKNQLGFMSNLLEQGQPQHGGKVRGVDPWQLNLKGRGGGKTPV